jgi:hypothetical protein
MFNPEYEPIEPPRCNYCNEPTPRKLLGWFGECPNCAFKVSIGFDIPRPDDEADISAADSEGENQ